MKAIIVDDEPKAIDLLQGYLNHFKSIELTATFRNGLKALEYLSKEHIDLVFLDINMPHISGLSLSKMLPDHTKVIFTTAYSEFAVESYEIQATDYLLKPISLERFTKSMSRILSDLESSTETKKTIIHVKSGLETYLLDCSTILFLEKDGNYIHYNCINKKIMARETIHESMRKLPESFIQTHKSYIVNKQKITRYDKNMLHIENKNIPIGDSFRADVFRNLM